MLGKLLFFVLLLVSILISEIIVLNINKVENERRISHSVIAINDLVESVFNDAVIAVDVLKEIVKISDQKTLSLEKFNQISASLLSEYHNVDAILLLPNGIVSYVYPYEENKLALGHDILNDENRRKGGLESIKNNDVRVIGPVTLIQNGKQAFIVRKAILSNNTFLGFTSSVVHLSSISELIKQELIREGMNNYKITGYNPDSGIAEEKLVLSKGDINNNDAVKGIINIFNVHWELSLASYQPSLKIKAVIFVCVFFHLMYDVAIDQVFY